MSLSEVPQLKLKLLGLPRIDGSSPSYQTVLKCFGNTEIQLCFARTSAVAMLVTVSIFEDIIGTHSSVCEEYLNL